MSPYDALMTALLLVAVIGMVINHRTGWLAGRIVRSSRHQSPGATYPRRRLSDTEERVVDLT